VKGKLIAFEGVEGCGKTTQIDRTCQWLGSRNAICHVSRTRQPGGTELGLKLRQLLLDPQSDLASSTELLLYAADRAQHVAEIIKPQLERGNIVLCDRYTDSTIAYQGYGRGLSLDTIQSLNRMATGGLESDVTLWLDVDVEIGLSRVKSRSKSDATPQGLDRLERDTLEFHRRVQQGYQKLARDYPKRIYRVDASLSVDLVQSQIQKVLSSFTY
jgi:dTMP kinase